MTIEYIYFFFFGACIGSFLNVLIYRIPLKANFTTKRSYCPHCKKDIPFYFNIPVLAFCCLGGKCKNCKSPIPKFYFFNECFMGLAAIVLLSGKNTLIPGISDIFYFSLLSALVVHFWIDLKHHILPDGINIYLLVLNLMMVILFLDLPWDYWLIGGLVGFGGPFLVTYFYYLWRKVVGLGGGDIKLFGAMGIFLGPKGIVLNIFFSCFLGSIIGLVALAKNKSGKQTPFAFGPAIIIITIFQVFLPVSFKKLASLIFSAY